MNLFILVASFFILLFLGIPIAYALCMSSILYMALYSEVPLIIIAQQMLKGVDSFTLMAIPFFVIAGSLMQNGGIARRMVNFAKSCIGFIPGGLAVVTIVTSMIFAAMTGAGAATTAAVGGIMIPFMKEEGYDADYASAVQAVGGIFGPLIPPSVLMVLYGVASGQSVGDMLLAGLIPGLFLGLIVIAVVLYHCVRKGYKGSGSFNMKEVGKNFVSAIWAMLAPVIILGGIYSGIFTPTEASAVACFYCLIIGVFVYREIKPKQVCSIVWDGVKSAASIMFIVGATQVFGWVITREGIPQVIATMFTSSINSPLIFLLAVCLILLIAGCFIDAVPALLIFAPIFCPTAQAYGIDMIHFGVVMVVVLCIGLVTPPVGINLFVASSVGGEPIHKIIPHLPKLILAVMAGALLIVLFPSLSTFLPGLLK